MVWNPYLDVLRKAQAEARLNPDLVMTTESLNNFDLGGVDCPYCENTGQLIERGENIGEFKVYECPCMAKRRSLRSLRRAGMEDMVRRYTMESYLADTEARKLVKDYAMRYLAQDSGWFFIAGISGSGKTHICTAICQGLMERAREIYFFPWRDESNVLKNGITEREWYEERIGKIKRVEVLYIDDFWQGGVTNADVKLAFEIINARYNNTALRTVISSELPLTEIARISKAIGGRIAERAGEFAIVAPNINARMKKGGESTGL